MNSHQWLLSCTAQLSVLVAERPLKPAIETFNVIIRSQRNELSWTIKAWLCHCPVQIKMLMFVMWCLRLCIYSSVIYRERDIHMSDCKIVYTLEIIVR